MRQKEYICKSQTDTIVWFTRHPAITHCMYPKFSEGAIEKSFADFGFV